MVICLAAVSLGRAYHSAGYRANYGDKTTKFQGVMGGMGNMIATVPGSVTGILGTYLKERYDSWMPLFVSMAVCQTLGALLFYTMSTVENMDTKVKLLLKGMPLEEARDKSFQLDDSKKAD